MGLVTMIDDRHGPGLVGAETLKDEELSLDDQLASLEGKWFPWGNKMGTDPTTTTTTGPVASERAVVVPTRRSRVLF